MKLGFNLNIAFGKNPSQIDDDLVKECSSIARIAGYVDTLPDKYNTKVGERGVKLSGGQIQRIGIARALYRNPKLLIMDEPTSALDIKTQEKILNLLLDIQKQRNLSYIFVSHDLGIVSKISDRINVLYKGKIIDSGQTKNVLSHPSHNYTKKLIN